MFVTFIQTFYYYSCLFYTFILFNKFSLIAYIILEKIVSFELKIFFKSIFITSVTNIINILPSKKNLDKVDNVFLYKIFIINLVFELI